MIEISKREEFYQQEYFASVEPFLIAHFLLYTTIAVLSALKQPFRLRGYVDSAIVFGLPLVAFPLQAALVDGESAAPVRAGLQRRLPVRHNASFGRYLAV